MLKKDDQLTFLLKKNQQKLEDYQVYGSPEGKRSADISELIYQRNQVTPSSIHFQVSTRACSIDKQHPKKPYWKSVKQNCKSTSPYQLFTHKPNSKSISKQRVNDFQIHLQDFQEATQSCQSCSTYQKDLLSLSRMNQIQEQQIKNMINGDLLKKLQTKINVLEIEKQILQQQQKHSLDQVFKELEIQKKLQQQYEEQLSQEAKKNSSLEQEMKGWKNKFYELESQIKKNILEQEDSKQVQIEFKAFIHQYQDNLEQLLQKQFQQRKLIYSINDYIMQLLKINQYLISHETPPLDMLVRQNKRRSMETEENELGYSKVEPSQMKKNMSVIVNRQIQIQMENNLLLSELQDQIEESVRKYSQKFISDIGLNFSYQ